MQGDGREQRVALDRRRRMVRTWPRGLQVPGGKARQHAGPHREPHAVEAASIDGEVLEDPVEPDFRGRLTGVVREVVGRAPHGHSRQGREKEPAAGRALLVEERVVGDVERRHAVPVERSHERSLRSRRDDRDVQDEQLVHPGRGDIERELVGARRQACGGTGLGVGNRPTERGRVPHHRPVRATPREGTRSRGPRWRAARSRSAAGSDPAGRAPAHGARPRPDRRRLRST